MCVPVVSFYGLRRLCSPRKKPVKHHKVIHLLYGGVEAVMFVEKS